MKFTIYGLPVAKGRPRFTRQGRVYTPSKTRDAEENFLAQAIKYAPEKPYDCALEITMNIFKPKPKSKSKKVKHWTTRPDLDNYIKIIDALNGVFWIDDSQIIKIVATKQYGDSARTEMEIKMVESEEGKNDK